MSATPNEAEQSSFNANSKPTNKCVVCGIAHGLWACDAFKKINIIDRYKKVKAAKLCFLCLLSGHHVKECKMKECVIDGCQKRHNRLLHRSESSSKLITKATETVETHTSVGLNKFGILLVNEVELSNYGYRLEVPALIDSGSSLSWIDKSVSDQLDLHGVNQNLTVSGINGIENHDSQLVQITMNIDEYGSQKLQMAIHKSLVIGDSYYDVQRMKRQYPQLANVPAKNIRPKDVKVILGTDCFSITRPLEYQRGKSDEPWAAEVHSVGR